MSERKEQQKEGIENTFKKQRMRELRGNKEKKQTKRKHCDIKSNRLNQIERRKVRIRRK